MYSSTLDTEIPTEVSAAEAAWHFTRKLEKQYREKEYCEVDQKITQLWKRHRTDDGKESISSGQEVWQKVSATGGSQPGGSAIPEKVTTDLMKSRESPTFGPILCIGSKWAPSLEQALGD